MDTLVYAFNAVAPILLLIAMGYAIKRMMNWSERFFSDLNNFCYRILLPIQLFYNVYRIERLGSVNWRIILYVIVWVPVAILIGIIAAKIFIKERNQKGVLAQAAFRSNQAILGLPLAISLGGNEAAAVASLATSIGIPLFNISAVIVLKSYGTAEGEKTRVKDVLKAIVTNPLIIGVASGILCIALRYILPMENNIPVFSIEKNLAFIYTAIKNLSSIASPVMLICLGAGLNLSLTKKLMPKICIGVFIRLILVPALAIGGAIAFRSFFNLTKVEIPMLVSFFGSPVAVSSAILAREMGADEQYASQLVIWSSVASMVTLFAFIAVLRSLGFL